MKLDDLEYFVGETLSRYALVSWAAAKGTSRVAFAAPVGAVRV